MKVVVFICNVYSKTNCPSKKEEVEIKMKTGVQVLISLFHQSFHNFLAKKKRGKNLLMENKAKQSKK